MDAPDEPEAELSWKERRADRKRLRGVRMQRAKQMSKDAKGKKNRSKGKDRKKGK